MANEIELKNFSLGNLQQICRLMQTTFATKKDIINSVNGNPTIYVKDDNMSEEDVMTALDSDD